MKSAKIENYISGTNQLDFNLDAPIRNDVDIPIVHSRETNNESELYLNENKSRLSNNCRILFDLFMKGARIHSNNSPVGDFRARCCDLKNKNGVHLHFDKIKLGNATLKEWYMTEADKLVNKNLIVNNKNNG